MVTETLPAASVVAPTLGPGLNETGSPDVLSATSRPGAGAPFTVAVNVTTAEPPGRNFTELDDADRPYTVSHFANSVTVEPDVSVAGSD
jgi:hypothetical protein